MLLTINIILFGILLLFFINYFQKKTNFLLDRISKNENHKLLLKLNNFVPLSGSFYFLFVIIFLTNNLNLNFTIICSLFFCLGIMSDSKLLKSPKIRFLIQFFLLFLFLFINKNLIIDTRIHNFNNILENEFLRILVISFFFLVLINGYNFIDGVNTLCSLNLLIVLFFLYKISNDLNILYFNNEIYILNLFLIVFILFNFFGKNFLGDGGVYGLGFLVGFLAITYSSLNINISPYFFANLLWYPAFENLFCIIRRSLSKKKNYLPDNNHLHQLLYKYLSNLKISKKKFILSSLCGIFINFYLLLIYLIGFTNYSETKFQILLIFINTVIYLIVYYKLNKITNA